jgi:transcriptional regulator with XRE-family HTH domain
MLHNDHLKTSSERLAELVHRLEQSEIYDLEGAKFDISEHIFSVMERQRVSKAKLAKLLGKSRPYVTKILQGNANFTLESLVRIARALECKLDLSNVLVPVRQEVAQFDWALAERTNAYPPNQRRECEYIRLVNPPNADKENDDALFAPAA